MQGMFNISAALSAVATLGFANHLYLKRYEPVRTSVTQTAIILLLQPPVLLLLLRQRDAPLEISFPKIVVATLVFFASSTTSLVFYRLSPFHPLAKVPGPLIFRISKLWNVYVAYTGRQHITLKVLHDVYGPIVRIGPNDVSVIDPESLISILGADGLGKGPGYLNFKRVGQPYPLLAMPAGEARNNRRRVWSRGLSTEAIREYQQIVVEKANQLAEGLDARAKSGVDLGEWLGFFAFDFMAEMMFGGGSEMLKAGKDTCGAMEVIRKGARITQTMMHIPWFSFLARHIPAISENQNRMRDFCVGWCTRRIGNGAEKKDLWYHLTDEAGFEKVKPAPAVVASDSALAIIAGSDTTSTAMANLFWCLMAHPTVYRQLQEEVDREYPAGIDPLLDTSRLGNMRYLTACLNESLRLLPPVLTNAPPVVHKGSGGKMISGHFIPEGTQVFLAPYAIQRNRKSFSPSPDEFIPARWLPDSRDKIPGGEIILNTDAFVPFSYGPTNCIGKNLAKLEMMMVVTMLVQKFEFKFAEGFDWEEWPNKHMDIFVTLTKPLKVDVKPRL